MFEIWWQDRLIDVVPSVADVPPGLKVRTREAGPVERVRGEAPDWRFSKVLAICLLSFTACVLIMTLSPVGEGGADDGLFNRPMLTRLVLPPDPVKDIAIAKKFTDDKVKQLFAGKTKGNSKARVSSLLAAWDEGTKGLFGRGNSDAIDVALGNLTGGSPGANNGFDGPHGGDGPGTGGLGIGGGPQTRRPGAGGSIEIGGRGRDRAAPPSGPIRVSDGLPRDVVAKVIRAHFNEIKFCYERVLQHREGLAGKVAVQFTIGPTGEVLEAAVAESTLADSEVEDCMLSRVKRWKFPEPAGGGTVEVNHPWIFRGAGDNDP